jgi:hypothetical protein
VEVIVACLAGAIAGALTLAGAPTVAVIVGGAVAPIFAAAARR